MADITKLKSLLDLYGVGVRAGVITPCVEDETYFRTLVDLPSMPQAVKDDWSSTGNIRHPITIAKDEDTSREESEASNEV